jgi:hypothetical protein
MGFALEDFKRYIACLVYIGRESNPVEALAFSAGYRRVPKMPWLKPLKRRMRSRAGRSRSPVYGLALRDQVALACQASQEAR